MMTPEQFKSWTKRFALRIIALVDSLPRSFTIRRIADQLLRAGTSVGANYRAADRAKSKADFISKMGTVEEECDASLYWMELLIESGCLRAEAIEDLMNEGREILAMTVSSINTARLNLKKS